jgi:hypothetical protein
LRHDPRAAFGWYSPHLFGVGELHPPNKRFCGQAAITPMTPGNMRANGVRSLAVLCNLYRHEKRHRKLPESWRLPAP